MSRSAVSDRLTPRPPSRPRAWAVAALTTGLAVSAAVIVPGCGGGPLRPGSEAQDHLRVFAEVRRAAPGGRVGLRIEAPAVSSRNGLKVELLEPGRSVRSLDIRPDPSKAGSWTAEVSLAAEAPEGFYTVTASARGRAPAKAAWIVGRAVGDFFIASAVDGVDPAGDIERYMRGFLGLGGNLIVIHDIINGKAWYPSAYCSKAAAAGSADDRVGRALDLADRLGIPVLLSVVWDMTRTTPGSERMAGMREVMRELWTLYGSHPSLFGFYDYQEGSGTYFAAHVREFSDAVKALDPGLFAACAPYLDDPLLAGYLAAIPSLDISIYQGAFEASYRPDNRKLFPVRRTRDFAALSAGAMRSAGKIALSHVELFGYLEMRHGGAYLAKPEDAFDQIASAATCAGPDGITLFTWHYNVHRMGKTNPAALETGAAVEKGLRYYRAVARDASAWPGGPALYIPYSDWWTDYWSASVVPALDALRTIGIAADIVPYIPPRGEEVLPFYPYGRNDDQLAAWLERKTTIVLADVAGMQDTDSGLLKAFVEKGGTALLFGPSIPHGDLFVRDALVGGTEGPALGRLRLSVREALGKQADAGRAFALGGAKAASWTPTAARAAAVYGDGGGAVLVNAFGKGLVVTSALSLKDMAGRAPGLLLDILDFALERSSRPRPFDWEGATVAMDVAQGALPGGGFLAAANPGPGPVGLLFRPRFLEPGRTYEWIDRVTGESRMVPGRDLETIRRTLRPHEAWALAIRVR